MDAVSDAGLRMQQIAAQLAALRSGGVPSTANAAPVGSGSATALTSAGGTGETSASFGSVLADAVASRGSASTAGAAGPAAATPGPAALLMPTTPARTAGSQAAEGVSTDLSHYANGRLPEAVLKPVGTGNHRLWAPAADKFQVMAAAAAHDGVRLGVNDSYRSYAEQVEMARRKGLYSQGGLAARPGTSDHGWGKSVDLSLDGRALTWMRAHASQYGFHANVPRESWHWTYEP